MAFGAETAELVVELKLKDNLSAGLAKASASVKSVGGAFGSLGAKIKGIATGPLNLVNLAIGKLAYRIGSELGQAIKDTFSKTIAFGEAVSKVASITKGTAEATSQLVDTLDYYGIAAEDQTRLVGMAQKNLGLLGTNTKLATKFQHDFGFSVLTAGGKVKDFNTILLQSADYFNNKQIPASTKAAALAKIYGRNWQQLIPVFQQGSAKLKAMEGDAIELSKADLANMNQFKDAQRAWDDAVGDLQIKIGSKLLPTLTRLAQTATKFVNDNADKIVQFFKDAAAAAEKLGKTITDTVVPIFRGIASAWNALPEDLKKFLVAGFVANKLTGGAVTKVAGGIAGLAVKGAGNALGGLLGRGATPANPVFVADVGGGIGGKLAGAAEGAAGLGSSAGVAGISTVASVVIPLALAAFAGAWARGNLGVGGTPINLRGNAFGQNTAGTPGNVPLGYFGKGPSPSNIPGFGPASALTARAQAQAMRDAASAAADDARETAALATVQNSYSAALAASTAHLRDEFRTRQALYRRERTALHGANQLGALSGSKQLAVLTADALAQKFAHSQAPFYRSTKNQERTIEALRKLQARLLQTGDTKTAAKIGHDIKTLEGAIKNIKPPVSYTTVNVSVAGIEKSSVTFNKYTTQRGATNDRGKG